MLTDKAAPHPRLSSFDLSQVELLVCFVRVLISRREGVGCYLLCGDFLEQETRV